MTSAAAAAAPAAPLRSHPKAPHLRLVVSQDKPQTAHFADEEARQLIATLGAGLTRPRPA